MRRSDLEHIIRAAANISDDDEIVVIGSQSVLGQFPDAPPELCVSMEADVYPRNHPERWDVIDGSIGELSPFHQMFGYYAQGVEESTAVLPADWKTRLIAVRNHNTRGATGLCLEVHDLLISKYVAGRDKDLRFVAAAARHHLANGVTMLQRLEATPLDAERRALVAARIARDFAAA
ncbi:MAG: DUF6036 family nucleotidyltransferase [Vicinamibacterales bacterium]